MTGTRGARCAGRRCRQKPCEARGAISDDPGAAAQTKARIGVDGANNLVAAWIDARTSPAHLRVSRKPAAGAWSASIDITPSPANVQSLALSVRPDGFAWAVWGDTRAGAANQDLWGSRYDPALNTWSAPVRLDDDPGTSANQSSPTVAFGPAEAMLAWRDNRLSANGDTQARRVQVTSGMADHFVLAYDGLNRLKTVSGPVAESFALDGPSNVTSRSGTTETYDKANRLTDDGAVHNVWSDADRLTSRGTDTFGYDPLDRMTTSNVGGTARTYTYNGDGLLQTRTGGVGASFLWNPASSPSALFKQNNDNLVYGLGPLYVVKADATTLTLARDGGRGVRAELSPTGVVTGAFRYRAYGQLAQAVGSGPTYLGYAEQLIDPTGLLYMRARWYDPATGRFFGRDPERGDAASPSGLNGFNYAGANPTMFADPSGRAFTTGDAAGGRCGPLCLAGISAERKAASAAATIVQTWTDATNAVGGALFGETASPVSGPQGVLILNDARGGLIGGFVGLFGDDNTMTLGSGLIVSRKNLGNDPSHNLTLAHEYGHIAQAQMLGPAYIPTYLALQAPAAFDWLLLSVVFREPVDFHDWNLMEIHAQSTIPGAPLFPSYELRK